MNLNATARGGAIERPRFIDDKSDLICRRTSREALANCNQSCRWMTLACLPALANSVTLSSTPD
jgi:hypothetical protein